MPQDPWAGLPDSSFDFSGLPDQEPVAPARPPSPLERIILGQPQEEKSWWDTAASYIPSPVKSAWDWASTAPEFIAEPVARKAMEFSEWINPERAADYSPRSLISAYAESLGNVVPSLASPINLATAGSFGAAGTAAKYGLPTVAKGLTNVGRALSAPVAVEGAQQIAQAENLPEALLGGVQTVGGVMGARAKVPQAKPTARPQAAPIHPLEDLPLRPPEQTPGRPAPILNTPEPKVQAPQQVFDPSTLQGLEPTKTGTAGQTMSWSGGRRRPTPVRPEVEMQFINPETQEVRPTSQAQPGDVPVIPETQPVTNQQMFERSKQLELENRPPTQSFEEQVLGPEFQPDVRLVSEPVPETGGMTTRVETPPETPQQPQGFADWLARLVKEESGELDVDRINELLRRIPERLRDSLSRLSPRAQLQKLEDARIAGEISETDYQLARQALSSKQNVAERITPETPVPAWNRQEMDSLSTERLRSYVRRYEERTNPSPESEAIVRYGRELLSERDATVDPYSGRPYAEQPEIGTNINDLYDLEGGVEQLHDWNTRDLRAFVEGNSQSGGELQRASDYGRGILQERQSQVAQAGGRTGPSTPSLESYSGIVQQVRGMTTDEVRNYIEEMGDNLYPEDVQPLISELQRSAVPTAGERAAINYLRQRAEELESQGIRISPGEQTTLEGVYRNFERPERPAKTLEEVEATKKTPALERLGKIIGEDRAQQLVTGEREIRFEEKPRRPGGRKKLGEYETASWGRWAKQELEDAAHWAKQAGDEIKPGITVKTKEATYTPKAFEVHYGSNDGKLQGVLITDMSGEGISILAVDPSLGLRRGKITFELLKQAFDRGVNEPSGGTSDFTKNLIDRVKRLVKSESGELDLEVIYKKINQIIDSISKSKVGQAIGKFIKDESGEINLDELNNIKSKLSNSAEHIKDVAMMPFRRLRNRIPRIIEENYNALPDDEWRAKFAKTIGEQTSGELREQAAWANKQNFQFPEQISAIQEVGSQLSKLADELDATPPTPEKLNILTAIRRFFTEESGEFDLDRMGRLLNLFEKQKRGALSADELAEATQLARESQAAAPKTAQSYFGGSPEVSTGPINPPNVGATSVTQSLADRLQAQTGGAGNQPPRPPRGPQYGPAPLIPRAAPQGFEQSVLGELWNAPRALQSVDLPGVTSAALRQARPLAFSRDWFKAWNSALQSFGSKEALNAINDKIKNSPYFKPRYEPVMDKAGQIVRYKELPSIAEELGVKMTDVIHHREEAIVSSLAEKIPGYGRYVKASNRAYTGFLNDLRAAKFEQLMEGAKALGRDPEIDRVLGKKIADYVNNATGRGSLKYFGERVNLEPISDLLGASLYSPRALSARLAFINPYNYTKMDPFVRKQYWQSLARIGVSWGAATGLASLMPGVKVSMDPNNSDFMKIRIGNTRIDPGAGFQQLMVLTNRQLPRSWGGGGITSSTSGKFTPFGKNPYVTRPGIAQEWMKNQMNPSARFVIDLWGASRREPFDLTDKTLQLALPMYATDIAEAAKGDATTAEFFAPFLSSLGVGAQTYEKGSFNKPQITPFIKQVTGVDVPTMQIGR